MLKQGARTKNRPRPLFDNKFVYRRKRLILFFVILSVKFRYFFGIERYLLIQPRTFVCANSAFENVLD